MLTNENETRIAELQRAIELEPAQADLYVQLGYAQFQAEQLEASQASFQQALTLDPAAAPAHNGLGRVYERQGEAQAALAAYEAAIALDTMGIPPYIGLGIVYFHLLGDYEAAGKAFVDGLAIQPNDPFALTLLGNTYARAGRFEAAIQALQQAITVQPDSHFALGNLSIVYLHLHRYQDMIDCCTRMIEIGDDSEPRRLLGYVYNHLGQHAEAITHLERSVALKPDDYEARGALASVYQTAGRHNEADEQYVIAANLAAQDNEYGRACFAAVTGDHDTALELLEIALTEGQLQPGWARIDPEFAFMQAEARFQTLINQ